MIATNVEDTVVNQIDGNPAFFQYSRFFEKRGMEVTEDQFPTFSMQHISMYAPSQNTSSRLAICSSVNPRRLNSLIFIVG